MAAPAVIGGVGLTGSVLGGIFGAIGASYQGQAQANMYNYQAGIAQMNQQIALQNADYERNVGEVQAQESGMKSRVQIGATAAAQASSGLDINRGSAAMVRGSEVEIAQQDQNIIRSNAARRAYGYEVESVEDTAQAGLYKTAAATSQTAGTLGVVTSLLSGGTSVATKWSQGMSTGLFPNILS